MIEQAACANLMGLEIIEAWLTASRQMIDLWRTTVREQQDAMLAAWRAQIVAAVVDAETKASVPEQPAAPPPPSARSRSVAVRSPQPAA